MAGMIKSNYTDKQREAVIAQALETPEGRVALAQAKTYHRHCA